MASSKSILIWVLQSAIAIIILPQFCLPQQTKSPFIRAGQMMVQPAMNLVRGGMRGTKMAGQLFQKTMAQSNGMVLNQRNRRQCQMPGNMEFPCIGDWRRSQSVPHSVHHLRPGDIDVVAALGDSLTAGTGALANDVFQVLTEYRGVSFNIGGDGNWTQYLTVPNILKQFNPSLYGYSVGSHSIDQDAPPGSLPGDFYNMAVTGAESDDIYKQAKLLVAKMRADPYVDFDRDWKLVTILIGHNDVCGHTCDRLDWIFPLKDASPKHYVENVAKVLDFLHREMPRTFINLMPIADVSIMRQIKVKPFPCIFTHAFGCPCLFDYKFATPLTDKKIKHFLNAYLQALEDLVNSGRYDTHEDFTVVIQPTLIRGRVPFHKPRKGAKSQPNVNYLAPDCFHWAQKTHAMVARATWNNLLEPIGLKTLNYDKNVPFLCPTSEYPYLATNLNSNTRQSDSMQGLKEDFNRMLTRTEQLQLSCTL